MKIYGIPNCDTVKKAIKFLNNKDIEFEFINFKKNIPTKKEIMNWKKSFNDWPVNKKGRTYKQLSESFESSSNEQKIALIQENTSLIKRPIIEYSNGTVLFGFNEKELDQLLS